ncbi:MAG: hypothetical protein J6W16_00880 [Methanobrevibacter sp.]|nr:hypothetical protein [Methanobrevibacter sp.]MBO7696078.1 hypothetical protein [Methanobrevibacter sp.]MBP5784124.1 hypothetical protein [Methanobrevibacter sp.]
MLTPTQRENFFKVASDILNSKKQTYKIAYDEAIRQMKAASIPDVYYPTDWVAEIDSILAKIQPGMSTQTVSSSQNSSMWQPSWLTDMPTTYTSTVSGTTKNIG